MQRMVDRNVTLRLPEDSDSSIGIVSLAATSSKAQPNEFGKRTLAFPLRWNSNQRDPLLRVFAANLDPFPLLLVKQMTMHPVGSLSYFVGQ